MSLKTGIPPAEWDEILTKMGGHVLQSRGWAEFQRALGKRVVYESGSGILIPSPNHERSNWEE